MYLVDGNNVMGQRVGWHRDKPAARRRLISDLVHFAEGGERVTVVFDGRPDPDTPDGSSRGDVQVFFAHPGATADDRIIELLDEQPERADWIVVTSDRELVSRAQSRGCRVLRSGELRRRLGD